jgi:prepilin peptidase CpaA
VLNALAASSLEAAMLWGVRAAFLSVLILICASDVRTRRIPNRFVAAGFAVALMWHAFAPPGSGLFDVVGAGALGIGPSIAGALAAFLLFMMLYWFKTMGAGDVKLMAMLGAFFGVGSLPVLVVSVFSVGGLLVLVRLVDGTRRRAVFTNLRVLAFGGLAALSGQAGPRFDARDTADRLPFALAIAGGAVALAALQWLGVLA